MQILKTRMTKPAAAKKAPAKPRRSSKAAKVAAKTRSRVVAKTKAASSVPARPKVTKKTQGYRLVGNEKVYTPQDDMAEGVMDLIRRNESGSAKHSPRSGLVIMQPQCGKTGVIIAIINKFLADCSKKRLSAQVIVVTGMADLSLTRQTRGRLIVTSRGSINERSGAWLDMQARESGVVFYPEEYPGFNESGIVVLNNSQKLKYNLNMPGVERRLVIADEVHFGNGKQGKLDDFLRLHGIRLDEQPAHWGVDGTINHFVGVSATPFAHMIMSENLQGLTGESLFKWFYQEPPKEYNGMQRMLDSGRLRRRENLFDHGEPTAFFKQVLRDFKKDCRKKGPGYIVIRAYGKQHTALLAYINQQGASIECFDTNKKNLGSLNNHLESKPRRPEIVVIKAGLKAGITLPANHYIHCWIETATLNSDTQVQAGVGRACGYNRNDDEYPIYCDIDHVHLCLSMYRKLMSKEEPIVPRGTQNKGMKTNDMYHVREVVPCETDGGFDEVKYRRVWKREVGPYVGKGKDKGEDDCRRQIARTSQNTILNSAELVHMGKRDSGSTVGAVFDGPPSKEAAEKFIRNKLGRGAHVHTTKAEVLNWHRRNCRSYAKALREHPEWEHSVVLLNTDEKETVSAGGSRAGLQKRKSALL